MPFRNEWIGGKKFNCIRCGHIGKRHNYLDTHKALCRACEYMVGIETEEARELVKENKPIPDRLKYLYTSKQLSLDE